MEEGVLVSPAWIVDVYVEGRVERYCIDSFMVSVVSEAYRRAVFVFPPDACRPVPPPNTMPLRSELGAEEVLGLVLEGCRRAVEILAEAGRERRRRFSILRYMMMLPPTSEEQRLAEADQAYRLCSTFFGEGLSASVARARRAYLVYTVGGEDTASKRMRGLMRIDPGFAERVARLFRERGSGPPPSLPTG